MTWESSLSSDQMTAVLDNAPVAIYVSAFDSYELLYANQLAKDLFDCKEDIPGLTCYQAAGFARPCPFCRCSKLTRSQLFVREFLHPRTGRIYQLSGKLLDWAGKPAHIEYILDITDKRQEEDRAEALKEQLQTTFRSIPCGLCVYQFDKEKISPVSHNPAFYEIMGYSQEHIQAVEQETSFLGVHPQDLAQLKKTIQEAIRKDGLLSHTYRLWNDRKREYRFIRLDGSVKSQPDGKKLLYGVYTDVSEPLRLEKELASANEKMQDIVNAIPGGVAIYKLSDIFETVYFSDGVPALTGYSVEEYQELIKKDAVQMTYWEDTAMVVARARQVIETHEGAEFEFRKQHRDGYIVWVRAQVRWLGKEEGRPLLHCVFHNISDLKEAQLEMDHLVNSIPGGIASYRVEGKRFVPTFYSDGVMALSGHSREEFEKLVGEDTLNVVYEPDRGRVTAAVKSSLRSGQVLDVFFRMRHKDGRLIWVHLNGRRMGPLSDHTRFYAVLTGMSAETRLFQSIANETADGIYVIDRESFDLLYVSETKGLFAKGPDCIGKKCYAALHGKNAPCGFCTLKSHRPDGEEHEMRVDGTNRYFSTRFRKTDWNGIPAYVKYVRDVTEEVTTRKEKKRLEQYFQTVVKNLPGGVAVVRYGPDGSMTPEYLSDGFAVMTSMTLEEAWALYRQDAMAGVYADDRDHVREQMEAYIASGENHWEIVYRLKTGEGGYLWVKNTLSMIQNEEGEQRVYAFYHDMTREQEEQERIRRQYNELILQHYRAPDPNAVLVGHCNITQNRILEIIDHTDSDLLGTFGMVREEFFTGLSRLVVDDGERQQFLQTYLNAPSLAAFRRNDTEQIQRCFIKLPGEPKGRYVQIKMNMVATPDSGDVTGILTVTDVTEQTVSDRILYQLSVSGNEFVVDLDLTRDSYTVISCSKNDGCLPPRTGRHSQWVKRMLEEKVVPRDREAYQRGLDPQQMLLRLQTGGSYTFAFSIVDDNADIRTKNMTVFAIDLRLGRVCLSRTDITDSLREQQGLLNMMAYTFELMAFIDVRKKSLTMYTRRTVLENLPPYCMDHYDTNVKKFVGHYHLDEEEGQARTQFQIQTILKKLGEKPAGYDFVLPYRDEEGLRYKQVNVLWGDENHRTVCLVRADVTDMLAAERQTKEALEKALAAAKKANRAKSDFLSAMSHDIRTPMNAIMGMTALAVAHLDDRDRVADCLHKISISSKHLLSLINDVLDMSKIEQSKVTFNRMKVSLPELLDQLSAMMGPQARAAGLRFTIVTQEIRHACFYGDPLRINQILINLLSNAIKFTPKGGRVDFLVEETDARQPGLACYRFTVSDTGIGMSQEFLPHLFEPFTRSPGAARVEGTGLGLSVTKGLLDQMGGHISVESRENHGSVFCVELVCEIAPAQEAVHPKDLAGASSNGAEQMPLAGYRFLVAEDNAINAEILCELLAMFGAESEVRTDGVQTVEAFCAAAEGAYDAILMDIQMPQMNGYEATRVIRETGRPDAKHIPIIAMTANAFAEDVQASLDAGMTAHIAKPIDVEVLRDTLAGALGRHENKTHL